MFLAESKRHFASVLFMLRRCKTFKKPSRKVIENINFILKVIESDIFLSYSFYTILFIVLSIFIRNNGKYRIDDIFTNFLIHSGVFFLGVLILKSILLLSIFDLSNRAEEINKMFGKYWMGYWFIPLFHFTLTQLLRLHKIRRYILPRLLLVALLFFNWERYGTFIAYHSIMTMKSLGNGYESNVIEGFTPFYFAKHIFIRIIFYAIIAFTYSIIIAQIKTFYNKSYNK